jgi:hypothetical protein
MSANRQAYAWVRQAGDDAPPDTHVANTVLARR